MLCHNMKGTPLADINSILEDDTRIATFQPVLQIGFWDYLGWGRQEEMWPIMVIALEYSNHET